MNLQESGQEVAQFPDPSGNRHADILSQLEQIKISRAFCNSARSKEFLSYVVEQVLAGRAENLKERSIGVDLFHRAPSYDTGDDPIVRVKAGEVRRRLAEYYAAEEQAPELQIELPVGSYIPIFHWRTGLPAPAPEIEVVELPPPPPTQLGKCKIIGFAAALAIAGIAAMLVIRAYSHHPSALDLFWGPLSETQQPILICVPSPVTYAVNSDLFPKSPAAQTGIYDSIMKRNATPLQLNSNTSIPWKEITPLVDFYVNKDDAYVANELSAFFARERRPSQVRFGRDYTYEDLRSSPAILIGAYNNPWTGRIMSDLPIGFRENGEVLWIEDRTKPGQVWKNGMEGRLGTKDFAIVARLMNSKTGQFLLIVSGIGMVGTKAAGQLISHEQDLEKALSTAPRGWERKNLEIVLETDIVDGSPSPPRAVAIKVW
ncbi:hypothetical protein ACOBR2_09705 [Telmatobacter bradus]|uniref:hypothetical protein n=1 Tax=Telmatobacter bradus TaxID=474953 RepID=UPI003B42CE78